jgi:hypothetical protein
MDLNQIIVGIETLVPGDHPLEYSQKELAAIKAMPVYSEYKPVKYVQDFSGDGTQVYDIFPSITTWSEGFSEITGVEYPVDDDEPAVILDLGEDYEVQTFPTGNKLRFLKDTPAATEEFRVITTGLRDYSTVQAVDEQAVISLAAGYFAEMLATWYSQTSDSTIRADSVDHKSRASEYAARAKILIACFYDHMIGKAGQDGVKRPAYGGVTWDSTSDGWLTNQVPAN